MNYNKFILLMVTSMSLCLMVACKKDKECNPPGCEDGYRCVDGKCICPEDMVQVNGNCILNLEGSYSGTFDCGCYNDLIITIFENQGLVGLYEGS